jgi:hypothetical protein
MTRTESDGLKTSAVLAGAGTGLGTLVIWLLNVVGIDLPPAASAALAGGIATITVYVVDHGLVGFFKLVWLGKDYELEETDHSRNGGDNLK